MAESNDDNLGDLLAQASEERTHQAVVVHTAPPVKTMDNKIKAVGTALLLIIGLALVGWAIYGAMLLRGTIESEKENAAFMAKLMLFGAGPLGVILTFAGVVTLTQLFSAKRR